jgi:hypothetical protein
MQRTGWTDLAMSRRSSWVLLKSGWWARRCSNRMKMISRCSVLTSAGEVSVVPPGIDHNILGLMFLDAPVIYEDA